MNESTIDSDCFGRYYSDSAPECKICKDAISCRKQTISAGYYVAPVTETVVGNQVYSVAEIQNVVSKCELSNSKIIAKKVSLFDSDNFRYCDIVCGSNNIMIYCKYAVSGLARFSETDPRPYRGKIVSYETLEAILRELRSKVGAS